MFRQLLTYQLILAVAAGPLLCCCTAGRLLASVAAPSSPAPHAAVAAEATAPCCAHKRPPAQPAPDRKHSDEAPAPSKPGDKCPCKDGSGKPQAVPAGAASAEFSTLLRAVASLDLPTPSGLDADLLPAPCGVESDQGRGPNAALPSTADLLFAHHNLSC
jgi:hypothetical protein